MEIACLVCTLSHRLETLLVAEIGLQDTMSARLKNGPNQESGPGLTHQMVGA
jgi:hypothetical protein